MTDSATMKEWVVLCSEEAQVWREQLEPEQRELVEFARLYRDRFELGVLEEDDRLILIAALADLLDGKPVEVPE